MRRTGKRPVSLERRRSSGRRAAPSSELFKALRPFPSGPENDQRRIEALTTIVLDLLVEVEALRAERIERIAQTGAALAESAYRHAYQKTAILNHNAGGPSTGIEKVLSRFYGTGPESTGPREALMLRRLGVSPEQVSGFVEEVDFAEQLS